MPSAADYSPSDHEITLPASQAVFLGFLILMELLLLLGVVMLGTHDLHGWMLIGVSAFFTPFLLAILASRPRRSLRLSPEGFAFGTVRRSYAYRWSDVEGFGMAVLPNPILFAPSHRLVSFTFRRSYPHEEKVRSVNQAFGGYDRFLPDNYGLRPEQLAALLEAWRERFGASPPHTSPP